ncbi:MAG: IclR family transcriptional regulator [Solirubrobacteraceae bacterium]
MGKHSGKQLNEPRYSQSLETGLLVMKGFSSGHPVQGIAEVADRLEASRSTVHRYMTTLVALGMLEQHPRTRRYRVALLPVDLGRAALDANRVVRACGDSLRRLRDTTGCTVRLATLLGQEALILDSERSFAAGQGLLGVQMRRGAKLPLHATALGKVLLGGMDGRQFKEQLGSMKLPKLTSKTLTGKRALEAAVGEARTKHVATEEEEYEQGVVSVAVPISDPAGWLVAALSLVAHTPEIALEAVLSQMPALEAAAGRIAAAVEPEEALRPHRVAA